MKKHMTGMVNESSETIRREMNKILEQNENENITDSNLWGYNGSCCKREAHSLNICIKNNPEKSQINNSAVLQGLRNIRESQTENRYMERNN